MTVRYVNALDVYLLPTPTQQDPTSVTGAVQTLLGAWVDADVANPNQGWVRCKDRKGRSDSMGAAARYSQGVCPLVFSTELQ
jgi:hypothetical protein